jgi:hypothetical protein
MDPRVCFVHGEEGPGSRGGEVCGADVISLGGKEGVRMLRTRGEVKKGGIGANCIGVWRFSWLDSSLAEQKRESSRLGKSEFRDLDVDNRAVQRRFFFLWREDISYH